MDRFTLAITGGVLLLIVVALGAAASQRQPPLPDPATPSGVVLAYALAEQRGDGQAAWDLLATDLQRTADRGQFILRVGSGHGEGTYVATEDEHVQGETASVVLVQTYVPAGGGFDLFASSRPTDRRTTVRLVHEPQGWRISVPPDPYTLTRLP